MKHTGIKIFFTLLLFVSVFIYADTARAANTCIYNFSSEKFLCDAPLNGQSPPPSGQCTWVSTSPADGMFCDYIPENYTEQDREGEGFCFSNGTEFVCTPDKTPRPPACRSGAPGENTMYCSGIPNEYFCTPGNSTFGTGVICTLNPQNPPPQDLGGSTSFCPPGTPPGQLCYVPLEPLPGLSQAQSGSGNFVELINGFFRILLSLGAFFAVTVLVIGGIAYMFSEKTFTKLGARERIKAGVIGLAILGGAWLLLYTINPQLVMFNSTLLSPAPSSPAPSSSQGDKLSGAALKQFRKDCEGGGGKVDSTPSGYICK